MSKDKYDWDNGAKIEDHSKKKLKILEEYLVDYLKIRCSLRLQKNFRCTIVDGFAGGGLYEGHIHGSPLVILDCLQKANTEINLERKIASPNLPELNFDIQLILVDRNAKTIELLQENSYGKIDFIKNELPNINIEVTFMDDKFESNMPNIKKLIELKGHNNILFNLDPYGFTQISYNTLNEIMALGDSVEIFYTFMIQPFLSFLNKHDKEKFNRRLRLFEFDESEVKELLENITNERSMAFAEVTVFEHFKSISNFVSPFSINNPGGWNYWLMHFSKQYRARGAYNDVLHRNSNFQFHCGRVGLNMLQYNPKNEGQGYLFGERDRILTIEELEYDLPQYFSKKQKRIPMTEFYTDICNMTPGNMEAIHTALFNIPDNKIITPGGGSRQMASKISAKDTIEQNEQRNIYHLLGPTKKLFR